MSVEAGNRCTRRSPRTFARRGAERTAVRSEAIPRLQKRLLVLLGVALGVSCLRPLYPQEMFLQHLPTVFCLFTLPAISRRFALSNAAFACLVVFLLFHVLGARYIYSNVPYDRWAEALLGMNLTEAFGFRRNHYDRLVHFLFGALWVRPVWEVCWRTFGVPKRFAFYAAFEFTLAFSMVYELFEWMIAILLSPESADAYNGQQGDLWDAQKDMSLALAGAAIAVLLLLYAERRREGRIPESTRR